MKIIGFTYDFEQKPKRNAPDTADLVLKCDSSLLNGRKPMFIPDWTHDLRFTPCIALRISRVGKNIQPRFATRYFDAVAPAVDFCACDVLAAARQAGKSDTTARAFDFSFAIGTFLPSEEGKIPGVSSFLWTKECATGGEESLPTEELLLQPEEAVANASRVMTLRQGDMLYIPYRMQALPATTDEILHAYDGTSEVLFCKIK